MADDTSFAADLSSAITDGSASGAPESVATPGDSSGSAVATVPPVDPEVTVSPSAPVSGKGKGQWMPLSAHETALKNAREKSAAEARAQAIQEWDAQYGWAKQVDKDTLTRVADLVQRSTQDPIGYLQTYLQDLQQHPVYSAQLRAMAQAALQRQQQTVTQEPKADLEYDMGNGQKVALFSEAQAAKREAWLRQQVLAEAQGPVQQLAQAVQALQQRDHVAQQALATEHYVETTYQDVLTWPGMQDKTAQAEVAHALASARIDEHDPVQVSLALHQAYRAVMLPKLLHQRNQSVALDLQQQAEAGRTVQPGKATTKPGKSLDEMTTAEALRHVASQMASAT